MVELKWESLIKRFIVVFMVGTFPNRKFGQCTYYEWYIVVEENYRAMAVNLSYLTGWAGNFKWIVSMPFTVQLPSGISPKCKKHIRAFVTEADPAQTLKARSVKLGMLGSWYRLV